MKTWLHVRVAIIYCLRRLRIIPDVWYECEIQLAKVKGEEIAELLKQHCEHVWITGRVDSRWKTCSFCHKQTFNGEEL